MIIGGGTASVSDITPTVAATAIHRMISYGNYTCNTCENPAGVTESQEVYARFRNGAFYSL